MNKTTR